jgi:hypothetical protein
MPLCARLAARSGWCVAGGTTTCTRARRGRFPSTAIYSYRLEAEDGPSTKRDVADLFKAAGIEVTL